MTDPLVLRDVTDVRGLRRVGSRAVVMTMGALHPGHAELLARARDLVGPRGQVVVTVFVNPTQFGPGEDFDRYPRDLEADLAVCSEQGVDAVFAPSSSVMYGEEGGDVTVDPGELGSVLEGAIRPGHFRGVLTVVLKLLDITAADLAVFGEKDYQQLVLIRRMVEAFNVAVQVHGVPTVREPDGLAISSRNVYLDATQRAAATSVPAALFVARRTAESGAAAREVVRAAEQVLDSQVGVVTDYVVLTGPDMEPAPADGEARLLLAARVGHTRLIDNTSVFLAGGS